MARIDEGSATGYVASIVGAPGIRRTVADSARLNTTEEETNKMDRFLIACATAGLLILGGCQSAPTQTPNIEPPKGETVKATLSEEAKQALAKAEADVKQAKAANALWTTAAEALKKAQEAAAKADNAAVLKFARTASEQAQLGLKQLSYPSTK